MENLRKRVDVKLIRANEEDKLRRLIASPAFARANIFDDDLAGIQMHKSRLVLNRPEYAGPCVLELSKHLMYDLLQSDEVSVWRALSAPLYRYRLAASRDPVRGCVPRHGQACRPLRHVRRSKRPPAPQHGEQEGAGQKEG